MLSFIEFIAEKNGNIGALRKGDLINIEIYLDRLYKEIGIELDLHRKHFIERMNEHRNGGKPISLQEVKNLFEKIYKKYAIHLETLAQHRGDRIEIVLQDLADGLNIPVMLTTPEKFKDHHSNMIAKTVIKKRDFTSSNPKFKV